MAQETNINGFHKDEDIAFTLAAKNRDGSVIDDVANVEVILNIGDTPEGAAVLTFSVAEGSVVLSDESTGVFTITLLATDLTDLVEDKKYYYTLWSKSATNVKILQNKGVFRLLNSIKIAS